jgi:hypothetical protein
MARGIFFCGGICMFNIVQLPGKKEEMNREGSTS